MFRSRLRAAALVLSLPLAAFAIAGTPASAIPPPSPGDGAQSTEEGPLDNNGVLAADPSQVPKPNRVSTAAAASLANCPPAPYGTQSVAPGSGKTVALTFDDGPGPSTLPIINVLQKYGVPGTFFNIGVNQAVFSTTVRGEAGFGLVLGNHTWDHPNMTTLSLADQGVQMDETTAEQMSLVNEPTCIFRPPYGSYNADTLTAAYQRHLAVWMWSVDTEDWKANGSSDPYWVNRIITRAEAGSSQQHPVILMHNQANPNPATVAALPTIIEYYRNLGYTFVDLHGGTGYGAAHPAAAKTASGVHLFARGTDGAVWERTRNNGVWTLWSSLGGTIYASPTAVATGPTETTVFVQGLDNRIWTRTVSDSGALTAWGSLDLPPILTSSPSATLGADGTLSLVVRGTDGAVWLTQRTGGQWSGWQSLGGSITIGPAITATGTNGLTLTALAADTSLLERHFADGAWSSWQSLGGGISAEPALTATVGDTGVVSLVRGNDNGGWFKVANPSTGPWTGWQPVGGLLISGFAALTEGTKLEAFALGLDNNVWERDATDGTNVSGWGSWYRVG